ncbi:MAG: 30S ribosomal protein S8 [Chitinophagales bacterium]
MIVTDPISDYLTRIRNAQMANHKMVVIPASNIKKRITEILYDQGYILKYKFEEDDKQGTIKIALKYNKETNEPAIKKLRKISKPGLRRYSRANNMPRVINGLGVAILSTSKGLMTGRMAEEQNIGGEILCEIY